MASSTLREVRYRLPEDLALNVEREAAQRQSSPDHIVTEALQVWLPSSQTAEQSDAKAFLEAIARLPEDVLRKIADTRLPEAEQARLSELLAINGEGALTDGESVELDALVRRSEAIGRQCIAARWALGEIGPPRR